MLNRSDLTDAKKRFRVAPGERGDRAVYRLENLHHGQDDGMVLRALSNTFRQAI